MNNIILTAMILLPHLSNVCAARNTIKVKRGCSILDMAQKHSWNALTSLLKVTSVLAQLLYTAPIPDIAKTLKTVFLCYTRTLTLYTFNSAVKVGGLVGGFIVTSSVLMDYL